MDKRKTTFIVIALFCILFVGMILAFEIGMNRIADKHVDHVFEEVIITPEPVEDYSVPLPG